MRAAGRNFLFVPGPSNVPDRIQRAMMIAMEDHRSSAFPSLAFGILDRLKQVFKTTAGRVFLFPSSGTGAWEAALMNLLSPGDHVLAFRFGQFSHLWVDMAQRLGLEVEVLDVEWGEGVPLERLEEILRLDTGRRIKSLLVCHNETTTGVTSDVAGVRALLDEFRHPALLMVDGVSSIACIDFRMDEWGVDAAVCGSQKGFMLPAGLGILAISARAIDLVAYAKSRRCYFDLSDMAKANDTGYFPYTPALQLLYGMQEALNLMFEEGLENIFARHHHLAEGVRSAVLNGWGLRLCARDRKWYSDTVSAVVVPKEVDARTVIDNAFRRYNLALGAGLSKLAGKVFRIGHLGDLNELMLGGALVGVEMAMRDAGIRISPGSGVAAASEYWRASRTRGQAGEGHLRRPANDPVTCET